MVSREDDRGVEMKKLYVVMCLNYDNTTNPVAIFGDHSLAKKYFDDEDLDSRWYYIIETKIDESCLEVFE